MNTEVIEKPAQEYGFGGRLTQQFPSQIIVDITEVCNLACVHCPHPAFKQSEHYGARYLEPELNQKLVDEVRDFGPGGAQYIRYTSDGEPLIHPKGYEMIEYAVRNSGVFVTITTNGTIMNEKRTRRLL
ncbi:MAG TPA: radical SAM protein, partial [Usitatibacter sp.]|nr:radical SAM protein [Usitatibacter sp.]